MSAHRLRQRPLPADRRPGGSGRGSRPAVRRRRLRGDQGAGRPAAATWSAISTGCSARWRPWRSPMPMSRAALAGDPARGAAAQRAGAMPLVYVQVDRGVAPRNHLFPKNVRPVADRHRPPRAPAQAARNLPRGVGVITLPDQRWKRCDIKSVSLLGQRAGAAGGRGGRMPGSMALRSRRLRDRGLELERLHRRPGDGRLITHPLGPADPGRGHPLGGAGTGAGRRHRGGGAAVHAGRGHRGARGVPDQHLLAGAAGDAIDGRPVANGDARLDHAARLLERYRDASDCGARDTGIVHLWLHIVRDARERSLAAVLRVVIAHRYGLVTVLGVHDLRRQWYTCVWHLGPDRCDGMPTCV